MKKTVILDYKTAKVLRQVAKSVPLKDIRTKKLGDIITRMKSALHEQEDGVAIAAPQIGIGLRIFVVSGKAQDMYRGRNKKLHTKENAEKKEDIVFINPEIVKISKKKRKMEEGCLSVRWLYGEVNRHEKVIVKGYDESSKLVTAGASGLLSQIFQHEIDHLNGVLFTDKAENLRDLPPEKDS